MILRRVERATIYVIGSFCGTRISHFCQFFRSTGELSDEISFLSPELSLIFWYNRAPRNECITRRTKFGEQGWSAIFHTEYIVTKNLS